MVTLAVNGLGAEGAKSIAPALAKMPNMVTLYLSGEEHEESVKTLQMFE